MERDLIHIYLWSRQRKYVLSRRAGGQSCGLQKKVLFARFLKNENSGELNILDSISDIEVLHLEKSYGFYKTLTEKEKKEVKKLYEALWNEVLRKVSGGSYDVLVMDEFMAAYRYGLIPNEEALCFLEKKPTGLEVVLTGRDPDLRLVEKADYVSEICKVKHPYDRGIRARRGIEY